MVRIIVVVKLRGERVYWLILQSITCCHHKLLRVVVRVVLDLSQEFQVVQVDLVKHNCVEVRIVKPIHPSIFRDTATEEGMDGYAHDAIVQVVYADSLVGHRNRTL